MSRVSGFFTHSRKPPLGSSLKPATQNLKSQLSI